MTIRPFTAHAAHIASVFFLALALMAAPSSAQTVYKCTSDGKISYGQAPCNSGVSVALEPTPTPIIQSTNPANPTTQSRADALRLQADQLTKERHRREAEDERSAQRAAKAATKQRENCAKLKLQKNWAEEDATYAAAHARHPGKATLKAHRAAEKFALACPH